MQNLTSAQETWENASDPKKPVRKGLRRRTSVRWRSPSGSVSQEMAYFISVSLSYPQLIHFSTAVKGILFATWQRDKVIHSSFNRDILARKAGHVFVKALKTETLTNKSPIQQQQNLGKWQSVCEHKIIILITNLSFPVSSIDPQDIFCTAF